MKFIDALNSLHAPWLAIIVMILGCAYSVIAHKYGLANDSAAGIIGAGIGLLTGQALQKQAPSTETKETK